MLCFTGDTYGVCSVSVPGVKIVSKRESSVAPSHSSSASSVSSADPTKLVVMTTTPSRVTQGPARVTTVATSGSGRARLLGAGGRPVQITTVRAAGASGDVAPARVVSGRPDVIVVQKGRKLMTSQPPAVVDAEGKQTILMQSGFEKVRNPELLITSQSQVHN